MVSYYVIEKLSYIITNYMQWKKFFPKQEVMKLYKHSLSCINCFQVLRRYPVCLLMLDSYY